MRGFRKRSDRGDGPSPQRQADLSLARIELYAAPSAILHRHNSIGFEPPADEYEPEVNRILPRLVRAGSEIEARAIVHEVFARMLGITAGLEAAAEELSLAEGRSGLRDANPVGGQLAW